MNHRTPGMTRRDFHRAMLLGGAGLAGMPPLRTLAETMAARGEAMAHPRLYFTPTQLVRLRSLHDTGVHARIWLNMFESAQWCAARPLRESWIAPISPDPIHENLYDRFYAMMHDMAVAEHLAFACAYSGGEYLAPARAWLRALCRIWSHEAQGDADAGKAYAVTRLLKGIAVSYDLLHQWLTPAERDEARDTIATIGGKYFDFFNNPATRFGPGYEPHHGSVEAASLGVAALAVLGEVPGAQTWLELMVEKHDRWLLPHALTPSGTHNQTSNFWISITQYRAAFLDALRRVTGTDLLAQHRLPYDIALAAAVGKGVPQGQYPQTNQSWLFGPGYGQIDYAAPALLFLAREYQQPLLQYLALWDPAMGAISRSQYITPNGEWMLFGWGGYAYAWCDAALTASSVTDAPRSFLFSDPHANPALHVNEAYARASYEDGGVCVGVRRGSVVIHAGGRPTFCGAIETEDKPYNLTLDDNTTTATITSGSGVLQLIRPGRVTLECRRSDSLKWWCHGPVTRDGDTLHGRDGTRLRLTRGRITAFDPEGQDMPLIVGMGLLKLNDPQPARYPLVTAEPEDGILALEVSRPEP